MSSFLLAQAHDFAFLMEEGVEGVFLYKIGLDGSVHDTWHPNVEEARAQAAHDVGTIVGPWRPVSAQQGEKLKSGRKAQ